MTKLFKTGVTAEGDITTTGFLKSTNSSGDEGGQIDLTKAATNTTITTGVTIDVFQNKLRIFETGSTNRGFYIDITTGSTSAGTNLAGSSYTLPTATSTVLGGVDLFSDTTQTVAANTVTATTSRTYGSQLNSSGQLVVNVPWTDTVYSLPTSTTAVLGGVRLFSDTAQTVAANTVSATASRTYGAQLNASSQLVVNVPWTDTVYSLPTGTSTVLGGIKLYSDTTQAVAAAAVTATASRTYGIQTNSSGQAVVNVPWTDTTNFLGLSGGALTGAVTFSDATPSVEGRLIASSGVFYVQAGTDGSDTGAVLTIARTLTTSTAISAFNIFATTSAFTGNVTTTGTINQQYTDWTYLLANFR